MNSSHSLLITSTLSAVATATFFYLGISLFFTEIIKLHHMLATLLSLLLSLASAAVIQLLLINNATIAAQGSRSLQEKRIAGIFAAFFCLVSITLSNSMWFAMYSFHKYASAETARIASYVETQIQNRLIAIESTTTAFASIAEHSKLAGERELDKKKGSSCANTLSAGGPGVLSQIRNLDASNFASQSLQLSAISPKLLGLLDDYKTSKISAQVAASKTNTILENPAISGAKNLAKERLLDARCKDLFISTQLNSIKTINTNPLATENLTEPNLHRDSLEASLALVKCLAFQCDDLKSYGVHIWLPPLLITSVIDLAILICVFWQAQQSPYLQWRQYHPQGQGGILQLLVKYYVRDNQHLLFLPVNLVTAHEKELELLVHKLEANEFIKMAGPPKKLEKALLQAKIGKNNPERLYYRFVIQPTFWKELNKIAVATTDKKEDPSKVISLFRDSFAGSKQL